MEESQNPYQKRMMTKRRAGAEEADEAKTAREKMRSWSLGISEADHGHLATAPERKSEQDKESAETKNDGGDEQIQLLKRSRKLMG